MTVGSQLEIDEDQLEQDPVNDSYKDTVPLAESKV